MNRFNFHRNNRHGKQAKSTCVANIEERCKCNKIKNKDEMHKNNFKDCLKEIKKTILPL